MADVLGAIGQSPILVNALNEPDVRELMKDPRNLELLAGMLRQAGTQARAIRGAANNPSPATSPAS
jgi:hydroxyethylthiazole kinase-like sugar kinase family protein